MHGLSSDKPREASGRYSWLERVLESFGTYPGRRRKLSTGHLRDARRIQSTHTELLYIRCKSSSMISYHLVKAPGSLKKGGRGVYAGYLISSYYSGWKALSQAVPLQYCTLFTIPRHQEPREAIGRRAGIRSFRRRFFCNPIVYTLRHVVHRLGRGFETNVF